MAFLSASDRALRLDLPPDVRLMNGVANVMAFVGALALCGVALLWLVRQPMFSIRAIRVEGDVARNSVPTIRANAAPRLAGNFLTLDLAARRLRVGAVGAPCGGEPGLAEPLVGAPGGTSPRRLWGADSATEKLVNDHGEVFEANVGDVEDDDLPTLQGPDASSAQVLSMWSRLEPMFAPLDAHVSTLSLSGRGSWQAVLDSGATIELGRGTDDEVLARTGTFIATLPQVTSRYQRPLAHADLRHNQGYAVRLKGVTTSVAPLADQPIRKQEPPMAHSRSFVASSPKPH